MEVKVISRETIKPSSPTPDHLRTYKLSLLDQLEIAESIYIPFILFYSFAAGDLGRRSDILKESLSKTLTHFYPFAGRVKDSFFIDCNDEGAIFVEAQVAIDMSDILKEPDTDLLLNLLPCDPLERSHEQSSKVMLAVQVSFFACGGTAICACVNHVVADAAAASTFLKAWATIASGANYIDDGVIYNCPSVFPPLDLSDFWKQVSSDEVNNKPSEPQAKIATKRFLFDGSKIAALKNEIGNGICSYRPSRFEAVTAVIWSVILSTTRTNCETFPAVSFALNLRSRMNPPLPPQCIGNVAHLIAVQVEQHTEETINLSSLARKIRESISKVDGDYVKKLHEDGAYLDIIKSKVNNKTFLFTSWSRFPFYETDFGWGKPIWFGTALRLDRSAIFLDTRDGEGIEAWITVNEEEMAKIEYSLCNLS